MLIFRNSARNIVYQAVLGNSAEWVKDQKLSEPDEFDRVELQLCVFRKTEKVVKETCRVSLATTDKATVAQALQKLCGAKLDIE